MSNLIQHAKQELEIAGMFDEDADYGGLLAKSTMELIEKFAEQGHSGGSAPSVIHMFSKLANFKPLGPITGKDEEWTEVSDGVFQNKRLSAVFKHGKDGKPYYLDAMVFKGQNGNTFTSSGSVKLKDGSTIQSRQFIKLPFTPKTFYVDVIETEWADKEETIKKEGGGWWTSIIKDESQLKEVFEYYDEYKSKKA